MTPVEPSFPLLSHLSLEVHLSLGGDVHGAPDQSTGDEAVIGGDDEERDDVEDQQGGGGVDLRVQPPSVGVRGAGDEGLVVAAAGGEGVQVREDGLGDGQGNGEDPDGSSSHTHAKPAARLWHIQRFDDGFVAEQGIGDEQELFKMTAAGTVFVCVLISTRPQVTSCCLITELISLSTRLDFDFYQE